MLGPLEVVTPTGHVQLGGAKMRALLAMLAIHVGEPVSEDRLVEVLWGDAPPRTAATTLHTYVSRLRRALAAAGDRLAVDTSGGGYRLRASDDALDVARVESLFHQARDAAERQDHAWASVALDEALRTWRGAPLDEFAHEPWATAEIARLEELRAVLLEERIDADLACGRHSTLLPELEALTTAHPFRERLWKQRIVSLYRAGRQADALRVYQDVRTVLTQEIGIEPSPELKRLEQQVLSQDPALAWTPAAAPVAKRRTPLLPSGVVTFLLTDIEGSTSLWELHPAAMTEALACHDNIIRGAIESADGVLLKARGEGDSTFSVFSKASNAVAVAHHLRRTFAQAAWPAEAALRLRIAIHTGEAVERDGDYFGPTVNRCARILGVGNGGQVLCSRATTELTGADIPTDAAWVDVGQHYLRGIDEPEHLYELGDVDQRAPSRPPRSPRRVPVAATRLVGRDRELADIEALLGANRLVVLTGVGGVGKTRLALEIASRDPNGCFCDLSVVSDDQLVGAAVSSAVGAPSGDDHLARFLARTGALLVLDNCEHLLDACASLVRDILDQCPAVRVLATSREAFGLPDEQAWPVPSLNAKDAMALFVERATAVRPAFILGAEDAAVVSGLCQRLDGIPLAIELAAARVSHLSPAQLAERLDDRFRLLTGGRHRSSRQQTLAAAMDWSYRLLIEPEKRLLRRLSVFAGPFQLEAAEAICSGDEMDVLDGIASLVAKSLVVVDDGGITMRYRLLETVRAYANDRLVDADEAATFRQRHCEWYVAWVEGVSPTDRASAARTALAVEADRANMTAATAWARAENRHDLVARMVAAMQAWLPVRYGALGNEKERTALELSQDALAALGDTHPDLRASLMATIASQRFTAGEGWHVAIPLGEEAVALARGNGSTPVLLDALIHLSYNLRDTPKLPERLALLNEHVQLSERSGETARALSGRYARFAVQLQLGDRDAAEVDADALVRMQHARIIFPYFVQPVLALLDGRFTDAQRFVRAHEIASVEEDPSLFDAQTGTNMLASYEQGQHHEIDRDVNTREPVTGSWLPLILESLLANDRGSMSRTLDRLCADDLALLNRGLSWTSTLCFLAETAATIEDHEHAATILGHLNEHGGSAVMIGDTVAVIGAADRYIGMLDALVDDHNAAVNRFETALALEEGLRSPPLIARTRLWYGRTLMASEPQRARALTRDAFATAKDLGMVTLADDCARLLESIV